MFVLPIRTIIVLFCSLLSQGLLAAEYKVAIRAHHGIEVAKKQWQPTIDALNERITKHSFTMLPILSLPDISTQAGKEAFEFLLTNPSSHVEIKELYHSKTLVTLNNRRSNTAQSRFGSVIFTHVRNKNILSIKDLSGKSLMAVSESAFGGWRVAWFEMLKNDFDPYEQLESLLFTKSKTHPEVVNAVREGKVDAGIVRTDLLERMEEKGELDLRYFRIINNKDIKSFPFFLSTALYPEWTVSAMKSVPAEISQQVKQALLSIPATSPAAKSGKYVGWVLPEDYNSVKDLMIELEVGPYAK